jgi:GAF domain/Pyridoxamine 5'-phosphate oxidase
VPLGSIRPAFQGIIPSPVGTASSLGVPNSTYLSIVWYVDEERLVVSNQFLHKTVSNLRENPFVALRVVDPTTMTEYELDATFLRSETSGELFEAVKTQLDAVAAESGMEEVFRLRSVELLEVQRCAPAGRATVSVPATAASSQLLANLDIFVRRLSECRDLAEATQVALHALEDLFGFRRSILLLADAADERLFAVAVNGHRRGNVGAEVPFGEGIIGVAAHRRRQVRLGSVDRLTRAGTGVSNPDGPPEIPLSGLDDGQSVLATPLLLHDRLVGVLYLDSLEPGRFDADDARLVDVLAGHLALTVALLEGGGLEPAVVANRPAAPPSRADEAVVAFYDHDGTVLVDGTYVIKGVAGRILFSLLHEHAASGRTEFTNREIRLDRSIGLPAGKDNLEARLLTLRRRLAEREDPFLLERVGRGRLQLTVDAPLRLERHDTI